MGDEPYPMKPASREQAVFTEALRRATPEARLAYLDGACGADTVLRGRVEALLRAAESAGDFLEQPPTGLAASDGSTLVVSGLSEKPGDRIGRYKLLQQIGEGGCGVVYMAEQEEPVRRRVALKVIKLGMDTKSVIARFEAERQALALMDHPNIAKVLDAGATEAGRPFFVMELVRGIKITDYCDQNNLSTEERLKLFTQVCQAIQHAHQKGIIHRDIKPSNILIADHDGVPVPKVIDFGIAKATTGQRLTDKTVFTAFEQFIGTPAYMSPEQANLSGLDIDTRTDIYALGVLLYELLTGQTPFDAKDLMAAGLDAMRHIIREQEPARPSTRLSTLLAADLTIVASHRHAEPDRLGTLLRGDLDWIVMKALEKDRTRRYETASALATDVQRHLNNEPVVACPPSRSYRFQKLVRRNKLAFAAGTAVALAFGGVASTWQAIRATRAEREQARQRQIAQTKEKKSEQVAQFLKDMLQSVGPSVALGRDTKMLREILDKTADRVSRDLQGQPEVEAELRTTIGRAYEELGEYAKAEAMHRAALHLHQSMFGPEHVASAESLHDLGWTLHRLGRHTEAESLFRESLAIQKKLLGDVHLEVALNLGHLAQTLQQQGRLHDAELLFRESLLMKTKLLGNANSVVAAALRDLGVVLRTQGKYAEAEPLLRESLAINRKSLSEPDPNLANSLHSLGVLLRLEGKLAEAALLLREALTMNRKLLGDLHPNMAIYGKNLGLTLVEQGQWAEGESMLRKALSMQRQLLGEEHRDVALTLHELGLALKSHGEGSEAELLLREALVMRKKLLGDANPDVALSMGVLGSLLSDQGKFVEAEKLLIEGNNLMEQAKFADPSAKRAALECLVCLYEVWNARAPHIGKAAKAAEWKEKLAVFDQNADNTKPPDKPKAK